MDKGIVYASGTRDPSSESMLHFAIYRARMDVQAVFHGHSREILLCVNKLNLPETREKAPYGSIELVRSVMEVLGDADFVLIRKHGFVSLGETMKEAGERAIETHRLCLQGC
jgi:L-fuculose-phosphate aldolase